jgi:hypothetical protein
MRELRHVGADFGSGCIETEPKLITSLIDHTQGFGYTSQALLFRENDSVKLVICPMMLPVLKIYVLGTHLECGYIPERHTVAGEVTRD